MDPSLLVVVVICTALVFDFTNGFHDTANAMATSIATGALRPRVAVAISAVLNLAGAFLSVEVAKTISSGLVDETRIGPAIVFGGLIGAIVWNLFTWYVGLPSSSSHALFGGLIGATWVSAGADSVHFAKIVDKVLIPAAASPIIAGAAAAAVTYLVYRFLVRKRGGRGFRVGQIVSASLVSLAHGTNDAQKTMGVITLTLVAAGSLPAGSAPPVWVIISAASALALGTYLGGWRITHTLGKGLTDIEGPQGFSAQTSSAVVILLSSHLGFPLSTTHVCSGGIIGSGVGRREAPVRWRMAGRMVLAWLFTLPAAAIVGAAAGKIASLGEAGTIAVGVAGILFAAGIYLLSRRKPVTAHSFQVPEPSAAETEPDRLAA
ncbi:inorganic phosphate transporter [Amycolatopsis rubida]|uniref:Phosphate transporter n=1 Tax=Amycolatopsis rubida TaxID=112413 RepID=A0A1I6BFY3_9PSEU|nr:MULTISPECIES: inorganic phosphate transporter [Amycolatopsis]NEC56202.1 inorganic phosphate transporter [Amycolatopsis rubida]OAP21069.1 Low-affinity inorganic phosphate transporter 1 [Amycolatopsis sp. M39]SFQ79841.1 inorganic phosphate transporter, PiT family [Amycolatopsis rubida]